LIGAAKVNPENTTGDQSAVAIDTHNLLDPFEVRVLAVLAEKEALTPDAYPLSLNALTNGCNQLSSREPVMRLPKVRCKKCWIV